MSLSCKNFSLTTFNIEIAKNIYYSLKSTNAPKKYIPKGQILDSRNKCKYLVTENDFLIPCLPSGSLYELQILTDYKIFIHDIKKSILFLKELKNYFNINILSFIYSKIIKKKYTIIAISIDSQISLPIIEIDLTEDEIK